MHSVTFDEVCNWLNRYFRCWQTADAAACARLFTPNADYVTSPYAEPWPDGERMRGRDQIAEFVDWITKDHLRFLDGGYDLWAITQREAYARWWADLEFRGLGYWVNAEGVFKLTYTDRSDDHLLCSELLEWNPIEPENARHYEPHVPEEAGGSQTRP